MCDTLGKIVSGDMALFAKNSDRSPNEPQIAEYRPSRENAEKTLRATYLEIPQTPHSYGTLLSRPAWMWGAEMGVNDQGVCIGNEAVFTRGPYAREGLTGMDLLRLGLERGQSARQALEVILRLLEEYGQGGNCGYDHSFYYDNAFLIMDRQEIYLLETAGKKWVYKEVKAGSLSNRLSIGRDGTAYSPGAPEDFAGKLREPLYSFFSGSKNRLALTGSCLAGGDEPKSMMQALRTHRKPDQNPLAHGDVASPCMHAGGLIGDHTTASMVVALGAEITVWLTGGSTPCVSLFKPWRFGNEAVGPVFVMGKAQAAAADWLRREAFLRKAVGHALPQAFYGERDALEAAWLAEAAGADAAQMDALSRKAAAEDEAFLQKWGQADLGPFMGSRGFQRYWQKKTAALQRPEHPVISGD